MAVKTVTYVPQNCYQTLGISLAFNTKQMVNVAFSGV